MSWGTGEATQRDGAGVGARGEAAGGQSSETPWKQRGATLTGCDMLGEKAKAVMVLDVLVDTAAEPVAVQLLPSNSQQ